MWTACSKRCGWSTLGQDSYELTYCAIISGHFTWILQEYNAKFMPDTQATREYEQELIALLSVIRPIAKSIKCLESAYTTVANVFVFFVAFMAEIEDLITTDRLDLPNAIIEQI
jgi:hypothetical protein